MPLSWTGLDEYGLHVVLSNILLSMILLIFRECSRHLSEAKSISQDAIAQHSIGGPEGKTEKSKPFLHKRKNKVYPEYQPQTKKSSKWMSSTKVTDNLKAKDEHSPSKAIKKEQEKSESRRDAEKEQVQYEENRTTNKEREEYELLENSNDQCPVTLRVHDVSKIKPDPSDSEDPGVTLTERDIKKAIKRLESVYSATSLRRQGDDWIVSVLSSKPHVPGVKFNCRGRVYKIENV